jgi:hypothetical protein
MNKLLLALAASLAFSAPAAASALQDLGAQAGVDVAPLAQSLKAARAFSAAEAPLMIPRRGKDVFEGCSAMDVKTFVALNPKQAALLVQTCLNHAYAADGRLSVRASAERFGSRACPENAGRMSCRAIVEVVGIKITVSGVLMTGDSVLLDLNSSLDSRGGKLLGFPAIVDNQAEIRN